MEKYGRVYKVFSIIKVCSSFQSAFFLPIGILRMVVFVDFVKFTVSVRHFAKGRLRRPDSGC